MSNVIQLEAITVRMDEEGRYCLNDIHKFAGGIKKHQPSNWLRLDSTQELIEEISCVFWLKLDKVSRRNWTRIPFEPGHGFWLKLDKDSSANWRHQIARG